MFREPYSVFLISIAFFCTFDCLVTSEVSHEQTELVLLHLLYRHGDRSPTQTYPNDNYTASSWPQGFGQLSTKGMQQQFELGQYLRKRYIGGSPYKLLTSNYSRYQIKIRSTDVDRTLMSAYSNLAGLFPPSNSSEMWNPTLDWQPIPVHTVPQLTDYMLNMDVTCPQYDEEYKKILLSDRIQQIEKQNKALFEFLMTKTGYTNLNVENLWELYDVLFCEQQHGFKLPDWVNRTWDDTNETIFDKLRGLDSLTFEIEFNQPTLKPYRGGVLLKEITEHMKSFSASTFNDTTKCFVYSAHDSTVAALASAMNVFNNISPPYASLLMVELHKTADKKYAVQVLYKNDSTRGAYILNIPGCQQLCPLDQFVSLLQENIPEDWHAECFGQSADKWLREHGLILAAVGIGALILCVIAIIVMLLMYRRRYHRYSRIERVNT